MRSGTETTATAIGSTQPTRFRTALRARRLPAVRSDSARDTDETVLAIVDDARVADGEVAAHRIDDGGVAGGNESVVSPVGRAEVEGDELVEGVAVADREAH